VGWPSTSPGARHEPVSRRDNALRRFLVLAIVDADGVPALSREASRRSADATAASRHQNGFVEHRYLYPSPPAR
jgi:hypothetical protein